MSKTFRDGAYRKELGRCLDLSLMPPNWLTKKIHRRRERAQQRKIERNSNEYLDIGPEDRFSYLCYSDDDGLNMILK